jgi:hypothetical protein
VCLAAAAIGCAPAAETLPSTAMGPAPLVLGQTLHVDSKILGQRRVINVYLPPAAGLRAGHRALPDLGGELDLGLRARPVTGAVP